MKDLILGFKLLKYSYRCRTNVIMLVVITAIGLYMEIISKGTQMLGGFYFMLTGMFAYQMMVYMDASHYVQSSIMKRKLQVVIPVMLSTFVYAVIFTLLIVEKLILIKVYPENASIICNSLFQIEILLFLSMIFCGTCYKYFFISFIVFMVVALTTISRMSSALMVRDVTELLGIGLGGLAVVGYVLIILGGIAEYILSSALYKKDLSELAMNGLIKSLK